MPHVSWKMTWPCVLLQDIQTCRKLVGCLFILEEKILGRFTNKIYHMHYSLLLRITDDMHPSQLPLFFNIWSYIHTHIYVERDLRSYSTSKPELQNPPNIFALLPQRTYFSLFQLSHDAQKWRKWSVQQTPRGLQATGHTPPPLIERWHSRNSPEADNSSIAVGWGWHPWITWHC